MRVLIVHRQYRHRGGEDRFLDDVLIPQLKASGMAYEAMIFAPLFARKSRIFNDLTETVGMVLGWERLRPSYHDVSKALNSKFDGVVFNNVIPTLSLALPELCHQQGLRTLMWVHNARLHCANGLLFNGSTKCRRCEEQGSHWAFLQKCHGSWLQSLIYAWIYRFQRVRKHIEKHMDQFIAVSEYAAKNLKSDHVTILRTVLSPSSKTSDQSPESLQDFKALKKPFLLFVGRLSYEKGIDIFLDMADRFQQFGFLVLGTGPLENSMKEKASENVHFAGHSDAVTLTWAYSNAHALVIPSRVGENAPMVIAESQAYKTPVIYTPGGGAEEMVKWLGRSGCALEEFKGQNFSREGVDLTEKRNEFTRLFEQVLKPL